MGKRCGVFEVMQTTPLFNACQDGTVVDFDAFFPCIGDVVLGLVETSRNAREAVAQSQERVNFNQSCCSVREGDYKGKARR